MLPPRPLPPVRLAALAGAILILGAAAPRAAAAPAPLAPPPYPPSTVIHGITWHWDTLRTAAPGSDLWPITWGDDGALYAGWGDGGGFGGTNDRGRVAMGIARIIGGPRDFVATNVNGGWRPEHPASFATGKVGNLLAVDGTIYAWRNLQNLPGGSGDRQLIWSDDHGATWYSVSWRFVHRPGKFLPRGFVNFGPGYAGVPAFLGHFIYFYGVRPGQDGDVLLARVPEDRIRDRAAIEVVAAVGPDGPRWTHDVAGAAPVFRAGTPVSGLDVSYVPALRRFLATSYHPGPGQLGVFDAPTPWGPWTTVAYEEHWGGMGSSGWGLTCHFPEKWMSADGRTLWAVFSVWGGSAQQGIAGHDRFNLVKVTLDAAPGGSS